MCTDRETDRDRDADEDRQRQGYRVETEIEVGIEKEVETEKRNRERHTPRPRDTQVKREVKQGSTDGQKKWSEFMRLGTLDLGSRDVLGRAGYLGE